MCGLGIVVKYMCYKIVNIYQYLQCSFLLEFSKSNTRTVQMLACTRSSFQELLQREKRKFYDQFKPLLKSYTCLRDVGLQIKNKIEENIHFLYMIAVELFGILGAQKYSPLLSYLIKAAFSLPKKYVYIKQQNYISVQC